jgi:hypothetical protein
MAALDRGSKPADECRPFVGNSDLHQWRDARDSPACLVRAHCIDHRSAAIDCRLDKTERRRERWRSMGGT